MGATRRSRLSVRNLDIYSINGCSALAVLAEGIKKAGTVDNAARIAEALRGLDFDTPIGHITYDARGDPCPPRSMSSRCKVGNLYRSIQNSQNPNAWVMKSNYRRQSPVVALF